MDVPAQGKEVISPFLQLFVLFSSLTDLVTPTCLGEGNLLYTVY